MVMYICKDIVKEDRLKNLSLCGINTNTDSNS